MNIIDTNGISYIFDHNISPQDNYYLVPDVAEEVEVTQLVHGRRIPNNILEIAQTHLFDKALYIDHYKNTLNKYGGRSFYNMTGFGDVSIIASLHMLMGVFDRQKQGQLFAVDEQVVVYTGDTRLIANINTEFTGRDIVIRPVANIS